MQPGLFNVVTGFVDLGSGSATENEKVVNRTGNYGRAKMG